MFNSVREKIAAAEHIFLTSHKNCPDAIGSLCALQTYLNYKGKSNYCFLSEPVPLHLREIPQSRYIRSVLPNVRNFDLHLIVDAGDLKQTGIEQELIPIIQNPMYSVINIDHHKTNNQFGNINIIDATASSTCEMVYHLLQEDEFPLSSAVARCLLTGIISDTSNFTNAATTSSAFQIAARLVWHGANIFHIIQNLFSIEESINTLRLWGKIFERLTYNKKYAIAISYVLTKDLKECNVSSDAIEVVANFLNYISGIKAGILVKEAQDGTFKISMRSTYPGVDVSELAKKLGGGGHKKAAGFSVNDLSFLRMNHGSIGFRFA